MKHKPGRYPGIRWSIIADPADPVAAFALSELQRAVQHRLPYVVEVEQTLDADLRRERHLLLVGTAAGSPALRELIARKAIPAPRGEEAFTVAVLDAPWERERKVVAIIGADPRGVLYGVQDFIARSLGGLPGEGTAKLRSEFDQLPACCRSEAPVVANRGVWTWGYVIYDYRRLFDNMARLRLNMVTIWNDVPPVKRRGDRALAGRCVEAVATLEFGWDREHGGIFYFLDAGGCPPDRLDWDQKLWWVHLETLVALLKGWSLTGRDECLRWFETVHEYTWRRFPDPRHGEWFGYLDRRGEPLLSLKGGKWKGCFHLPRALLLCSEELQRIGAVGLP